MEFLKNNTATEITAKQYKDCDSNELSVVNNVVGTAWEGKQPSPATLVGI